MRRLTLTGALFALPPLGFWILASLWLFLGVAWGKNLLGRQGGIPEGIGYLVGFGFPVIPLGLSVLALKKEGRSALNLAGIAVGSLLTLVALLAAFARQS